ncbi:MULTISPECIES: hypothetical protein [unclassified Myroides]|uniref:hypothetical protein n=1 Tax=unclassified Myroides TaxID=2642485 RepID=UPI003D2F7233
MKKKYSFFLCLLLSLTGCNSDQSPTKDEQQNELPSVYESITQAYQQKREAPSKQTTAGFWGWVKKIATADAKAAAAYAVKHGMKSDWKEALLVGAAASVEAALSGKSANITSTEAGLLPYQTMVLPDVQQIKSAAFEPNYMDDLGFTHYILVNEVLQDSSLAHLSSSDRQGAIYDKVYEQAQRLGIETIYDKQEAIALLNQIQKTADNTSNVYDEQLFTFDTPEEYQAFKAIDQLYTRTFNKIKSHVVFTAYSKEMESAVLQDSHLSQQTKEVLLLEMATYRFGYTYYSASK